MKIYQPTARDGINTVFVQPGRTYPISDWMDINGKPMMYTVVFKYGMAEVPDNLARYMVDHELASYSPILLGVFA